jgi:hypothetical protein
MSDGGPDIEAQEQELFSPARLSFNHLVMVAGHSVYTGRNFADAKQNSNWFLVPYQQVPGTAESFVEHIEEGVKVHVLMHRICLCMGVPWFCTTQ